MFFKNKVKFYPKLKNLNHKENIINSSDYKRHWVKDQQSILREKYKESLYKNERSELLSLARCPGLSSLFNYGFTLCFHKDVFVHSYGDLSDPTIDIYEKENSKLIFNYDFQLFPPIISTGIEPPFSETSSRYIYKYKFPYFVDCPDDTVLLTLPLTLSNNYNFSIIPGLLDSKLSSEMNLLFWFHQHDFENLDPYAYFFEKETFYFKKGSPIAQLIPIKRSCISEYQVVDNHLELEKQLEKSSFIEYLKSFQHETHKLINYVDMRKKILSYEKRQKKCPFHI